MAFDLGLGEPQDFALLMLRLDFIRKSALSIYGSRLSGRSSRFGVVQRRCNSHVVNNARPFRMAVIGSGPAGFYTAYKVMSSIQGAKVDMYEHLPVPFGLVRFGVAPDHPEVKVGCKNVVLLLYTSYLYQHLGLP